MNNNKNTCQVKELPCLVLLVAHKDRETLLKYEKFLKNSVSAFDGEFFDSRDYVDEIMLIFKFTDFENYHAFAEFAKAKR